MSIEKYNRVKETPKYQVERIHMSDLKARTPYVLLHIGCYQSMNYGNTCYADITTDGTDRKRFSLPKRMYDQIEEMSHDDETMRDVHDQKTTITVIPYDTKAGNHTYLVEFHDRAE